MQNQYPRMFAYGASSLMLGASYYVFTHGFYHYVEMGGWYGVGMWIGLIVTIVHVNYMLGKRFVKKAFTQEIYPYVLGLLFAIPIIIQIMARKEVGVFELKPVLFFVVIISAEIGAFIGVAKGKIARALLVKKIQEKNSQVSINEQ